MWLLINMTWFLLSTLHLWSTPRFQFQKTRLISLHWSFVPVIINLIAWMGLEFPSHANLWFFWSSCHSSLTLLLPPITLFNIDAISTPLIILSTLLIPLSILASWNSIKFLYKEFVLCLFTINILLMLAFSVLDLMWFYMFFEGILIPMFLLIGVWGSRQDKMSAAFYFFFFTLLGSTLFLLAMFQLYGLTGTTNYLLLQLFYIPDMTQYTLFWAFTLSFAVKLPQFPFHTWLPQAHVEAPVAGSVVLAGILLKLGGYGYISFCLPLFPQAINFFSPLMCLLGIIAILWGSMTTLSQTDMKSLVAYSSVAHMGLVTLALFSNSPEGYLGALLIMMAHGFVSPALFIAVTLLYDRFHTRLIKYYSGVTYCAPMFALYFITLSLMNMGLPPTSNFMAEFICLLSMFQTSPLASFLGGCGVMFSAGYALWFCNRICFGSLSPHLINLSDLSRREFLMMAPLMTIPSLLGLFPHSLCYPLTLLSTLSYHTL